MQHELSGWQGTLAWHLNDPETAGHERLLPGLVSGRAGYQRQMATALSDRERVDEVDWTDPLPRIGRSAARWIDLEKPTYDDIAHLADAFDLECRTGDDVGRDLTQPRLVDHGTYVHASAIARVPEWI